MKLNPPKDQNLEATVTPEASFLRKWLVAFCHKLSFKSKPRPVVPTYCHTTRAVRPALPIQAAKAINLLNQPLFWGGLLFLSWLVVLNPILRWLADPADYVRWLTPFKKWESIVGAMVIGYWTNWLAIKNVILSPTSQPGLAGARPFP